MMMEASRNGHADVVRYLLGLGVLVVDVRSSVGRTRLDTAYEFRHLDRVRVLVEEGGVDVDVDVERMRGIESPFVLACQGGDVGVVGSEIWKRGLMVAIWYGWVEVVRLLLEKGVDVDNAGERGGRYRCVWRAGWGGWRS